MFSEIEGIWYPFLAGYEEKKKRRHLVHPLNKMPSAKYLVSNVVQFLILKQLNFKMFQCL